MVDSSTADELLPIIYEDLRRVAAAKMAGETRADSLQPTALVNEAYLRIVESVADQRWDGCGHLYSVAVESMRRILVERARRRSRVRHGGEHRRLDLDAADSTGEHNHEDVLALNEAINALAVEHPIAAKVVKMRYFASMTIAETAALLSLSADQVNREWARARTYLRDNI